MHSIIDFVRRVFSIPKLRNKILFTLGIFFVFRFLAHIPVPGADVERLQNIFASNQFLSFLNIFSGGTLANFSIMAVGINPYITASIVMQLASMVFPALKEMQKEGESGRERVNQYTRLFTIPLAVVQSVSVIALLNSQQLLDTSNPLSLVALVTSLVAGAMIVMWLGELVSEYGLGNGISMILLGGILSQFPMVIAQTLTTTSVQQFTTTLTLGLMSLAVVGIIVFMNEAVRKIKIQYARRTRGSRVYGGQTTHLPIRVNIAGVMPIIFGISIMMVPSFISRFLVVSGKTKLVEFGQLLDTWFNPTSVVYMTIYFFIVFGFTFFSALLFFNAQDMSEELKKSGAFIPGVRPGGPTKKFLEFVVTRISLVGAIFLGSIAILPSFTEIYSGVGNLAIGGTSILIVVSVILETSKRVESMLVGQNYDQYI
ncbi:preprotein translocase subunit SecY [Patescibacteria group bacterium]|nr:preprotein translocase subunit SecY [Patescibacteria group bacterium]MBU1966919.1 preprotein translocase subunit SecY [Patescibacteria group bacterium]MBU2543733.1 preprotein translocase subunit SecY [Patescibacteria group bacterium]